MKEGYKGYGISKTWQVVRSQVQEPARTTHPVKHTGISRSKTPRTGESDIVAQSGLFMCKHWSGWWQFG